MSADDLVRTILLRFMGTCTPDELRIRDLIEQNWRPDMASIAVREVTDMLCKLAEAYERGGITEGIRTHNDLLGALNARLSYGIAVSGIISEEVLTK